MDGAHGCRRVMCVELSRCSRRCCRFVACRRRRHTPLSYQFFLSILLSVHHFIDFSYEIFIHTYKIAALYICEVREENTFLCLNFDARVCEN